MIWWMLLIAVIIVIIFLMLNNIKDILLQAKIIGFILFLGVFFGVLIPWAKAPHEALNYHIPYCPDDSMIHYEHELRWFENETDVIDQFHNHGWFNIMSTTHNEDGFLRGQYIIISGDCYTGRVEK